MNKTGPEIRHDAKERMKKYRAEMTAKGYTSTTIFLSQEHRAELRRLGDEHRLTRAEAAEHIFKIYLESDNKNITHTHNTNTIQRAEILYTLASLEAKIKALEERDSKQVKIIEDPAPAIESKPETPDKGQKSAKPIRETQIEIPGPKPDQNMELPDYLVDVNPDMPIEERHKIILRLSENFPGRAKGIPQKRIDMLNAAGILLNGKSWKTTKQFADQLSIARRWAKKQVEKS